ncbi:MAG: hypothetical protein BWY69_00898 [Planctomycetes bacterium ADurb.Bin401]|nr:MAG: hypothetical protein BWY69_00898 [Planctomycetes bacterium ADurb.Bin401]
MIGYMLTWRTYGTWLQGDERGYIKDGQLLNQNQKLEQANKENLKKEPIEFNAMQIEAVKKSIIQEAKRLNQKIYALSVLPNHIHLLVEKIDESIESTAAFYKTTARISLYKNGLEGKIWAKGYDKRYIFTQEELLNRMVYILKHN